jgi:hypothetical protein
MSNINTTSSFDFPGSNKGMHYETRCGNLMKVIWHDGQDACLFTKRCASSTKSGEARAGPILSRTFTGTLGSYACVGLGTTCRG